MSATYLPLMSLYNLSLKPVLVVHLNLLITPTELLHYILHFFKVYVGLETNIMTSSLSPVLSMYICCLSVEYFKAHNITIISHCLANKKRSEAISTSPGDLEAKKAKFVLTLIECNVLRVAG